MRLRIDPMQLISKLTNIIMDVLAAKCQDDDSFSQKLLHDHSLRAEVILKIRAEFLSSATANTILVQMPLPSYTTRVTFELEPGAVGQTTDFTEASKKLEWSLKKIVGGAEHTLRAKLTFSQESHGNLNKEAGPVSMNFTIPMYNDSRLQLISKLANIIMDVLAAKCQDDDSFSQKLLHVFCCRVAAYIAFTSFDFQLYWL